MIQPTIGRIVCYYPFNPDSPEGASKIEVGLHAGPLAAIIVFVWSNTGMVNLTVFNINGDSYGHVRVPLIQPGSERPADGKFCEWMPYQVKKETGSESGEKEAGTQEI